MRTSMLVHYAKFCEGSWHCFEFLALFFFKDLLQHLRLMPFEDMLKVSSVSAVD